MSVNIIVNEKFIKNKLLDDPERVKKEIENERRKMRIQQVRDVSKNIAKKVRNNVEMEKEKQLKIIEDIKAKEMEMWHQNVLVQKQKDFRSAIFQVGTAHRAAQSDNTRQVVKNQTRQKKTLKRYKTAAKIDKENILKNANVQTDVSGNCLSKSPKPTTSVKYRNISACVDMHNTNGRETYSNLRNDSTCLETDSSSDFSESSILSLSDTDDQPKIELRRTNKWKPSNIKTQNSQVLKEDVQKSDSSLVSIQNTEIQNNSNENVTAVASKKSPIKKNCELNILIEHKPTTEEPSSSVNTKKRFTQISDIIRMQKSSDETECEGNPTLQYQDTFHNPKSQANTKPKHPVSLKKQAPTKLTPKSPTISRPLSALTARTHGTKSSSSSRSTATRVQFYDYKNKFQKHYDQPLSTVVTHDPKSDDLDMNAMDRAALSDQFREGREAEMEKLRQKSTERCEKAIEREQVRRACEELTAKLDGLAVQRPALPSDNYQFASYRLAQIAKGRENKLNNAVEDLLSRPAVITCPVIDHQQPEFTKEIGSSKSQNNGLNLGSEFTRNNNNSLNSSDSCCSILLGYVDGQSKQIADDIQKYNKQNGEIEKAKAEKLQNLLNKINRLRLNLMEEIKKCTSLDLTDKEGVQLVMDSINQFKKERENIMTSDSFKDSISKRESDLKKKEAVLEKKLREFYEIQTTAKKKEKSEAAKEESKSLLSHQTQHQTISEDTTKTKRSQNLRSDSIPLENEKHDKPPKSESLQKQKQKLQNIKSPNKSSSSDGENECDEFFERKELLVNLQPLEIIIKVKGDSKNFRKIKKIPSKSPRKLSTLIQSPTPKKPRRKSTTVQSIDSNSTSYRSLPSVIHNNVDEILKNNPKTSKGTILKNSLNKLPSEETKKNLKKPSSNLNPLMAHYVQRLLGMSRNSINALEVVSSDIETPSSSIINVTANLSAEETEKLTTSRLENVQKFIEDNYSFIGELEQSLRNTSSTDSSQKAIEVAWEKALKVDKTTKKDADVKKILKPSLKKPPKKQKLHFNDTKQAAALVDKSTQKTDNCTQRIAELTEMINKVRKEKQKILETTLSSVSETGRNSTEYLDLPDRRDNSEESTSKILDTQLIKSIDNLPTESPENTQFLEKHKSTGMSRDSGISLSRPITVQESRDSPIEDTQQVQSSTESLSVQFKKNKPPISITRYSPQIPEDIPHELSTIFEVDTPATSRLNTSIHVTNGEDNPIMVPLKGNPTEKITYKKFPSFEEYVRTNQLDMSQFDPEFSLQFEKEFNEFISLAKKGKVAEYEEFTSFSKYLTKSSSIDNKEAAEEFLASLKMANMSFKRFPTRKEYLEKIGVSNSDLLDSQSLENIEESRNSSSSTSLMNVEDELMLRKILTKSFKQNRQTNDKYNSLISTSTLVSQRKQPGEISGIMQFTGSSSTDEKSDDLENGLKRLGIKWPSAMKKKTMETQALSSSTSSNIEPSSASRRKPPTFSQPMETSCQKETNSAYDTLQTDDGGQQLNLREFLKKELLKRTTTSSSFSFSDDSVASSILRSIIGSITSSQPQQANEAGGPTLDRHKTSTPMASQSMSSAKVGSKSQGGASSLQLFSGESRLSSVHFNNSSKDINKTTEKNLNSDSSKKL